MNTRWWRARVVASAAFVLAVLAAAALIGLRGNGDDGESDPPPESTTSTTITIDTDLIELLTVTTTTVDCEKLVGEGATKKLDDGTAVIDFEVGALAPVADGGRKWSDAISTPFKATVPKDALKEIQAAICQDPLLGATVAHLFAGFEVQGVKVVDLNDWLKPYGMEADQINDLAAGFIPLLDVSGTPNQEQLAEAISQNLEYQRLAEKLGTLLDRFSVVGIQAEQSVLNYQLTSGGLVVGKIPEVAINATQESLPALVLELNAKPGICLARLGFNAGDKRPEIFDCPPVNPPTAPPSGGSTTTTPPATTAPCGDKSSGRLPDESCGVPYTTVPRSDTTTPGTGTTRPTVPPTAPPDTLPPGVTPTTWDVVPTPSTIQLPDSPPVTGTAPTTVPPPATAPPATNTGTVPRP